MTISKLFLNSMRAQVESDIHGFHPSDGLPITIFTAARYSSFTASQFKFCWEGLLKLCMCFSTILWLNRATVAADLSSTVHYIWLPDCRSSQPQHCYHPAIIPKITNIGLLPFTYVFKATSKLLRDSQVVHLISMSTRRVLPAQFIKRTLLEC